MSFTCSFIAAVSGIRNTLTIIRQVGSYQNICWDSKSLQTQIETCKSDKKKKKNSITSHSGKIIKHESYNFENTINIITKEYA